MNMLVLIIQAMLLCGIALHPATGWLYWAYVAIAALNVLGNLLALHYPARFCKMRNSDNVLLRHMDERTRQQAIYTATLVEVALAAYVASLHWNLLALWF